jgi:hypothetical protein
MSWKGVLIVAGIALVTIFVYERWVKPRLLATA